MGAAVAFARANGIDKILIASPRPRLGIVASGLAAFAVLEALDSLGIAPEFAAELGISVLKIGMPHPIDELSLRQFCDGLEEVLVVEVVNHFTKTTRFVKQITTEKSVIIVITKGMTTTPATITRTTFILTDTNASRNTALMMSRLATLKTTLSTKGDILELKMT